MRRMLKVLLLVMLGALPVVLCQDLDNSQVGVEKSRKPGSCPEISEGSETAPQCSELCAEQENCTCKSDSQCEGSLKCCETICGNMCIPPVFRNPCQDNFDCPWSLKCCEGVCDSDCVYQPKNRAPTE